MQEFRETSGFSGLPTAAIVLLMLFDSEKFLLIAGPCTLESETICRTVASELVSLKERHPELIIIFKGSFDKANRTSGTSVRGPGMDEGLRLLKLIKDETGLPVITDIHLPEQAEPVAQVCDVLQIPAFLCRQTDILEAAAATQRTVNVKKGQFLAPQDMEYVVAKLRNAGAREIWQTERGTTFGYQNLTVDMRSFPIMKRFGQPVIMDATHGVQLPGGAGGASGGNREFVPVLARAALAAGANGIFAEVHPDPDKAVSDGASQLRLHEFADMVKNWLDLWRLTRD